MQFVYILLALCLILLLVVGIHELGHYLLARSFKVVIKRFVLGLGKPFLVYKCRSGLELALAPFPIGGYVKLLDEREMKVPEGLKSQTFNAQPPYKRILILLAGPIINLLAAWLIFSNMFLFGKLFYYPEIGAVSNNSIAAIAGLKAGDKIISVDGWRTYNWSLATMALFLNSSNPKGVAVDVISSSNQVKHLKFDLKSWQLTESIKPIELLGITVLPMENKKSYPRQSWSSAVSKGLYVTWQYIALNTLLIKKLLMGKISMALLAGPLSFINVAGSFFKLGLEQFLYFIALLSIAVGVTNLLPIPSLDGGHILFIIVEKVRHKPISMEAQILAYRLALAFFFVFFMHLLANDVRRLDKIFNAQKTPVSSSLHEVAPKNKETE